MISTFGVDSVSSRLRNLMKDKLNADLSIREQVTPLLPAPNVAKKNGKRLGLSRNPDEKNKPKVLQC